MPLLDQLPADAERLHRALSRRHDDTSGQWGAAWWQLARDAYEGAGGFLPPHRRADAYGGWNNAEQGAPDLAVQNAPSYLVKFPRESVEYFHARKQRAVYRNVVAPVVDIYLGHLRRSPPLRSAGAPLRAWWQNVDGRGSSLDAWLSVGMQRAQLYGWAAALVDRPAGDLPISAGDPTRATWLQPEELRDWQIAADGTLEWALLGSEIEQRDAATGDEVEVYEYTLWTRTEWARVRLVERDEVYSVEARDGGEHALGRVPLALLRWAPSVGAGALYGISQVAGVIPLAVELFNVESELSHHLASSNFALLTINGDDPQRYANAKLGSNNALVYPLGAAAPAFIGPPADIAVQYALRAEQLIDAAFQAAKLERPSAQPAQDAASGIARAYDFAATEATLQGFAKQCEAFERDLCALWSAWRGQPQDAELSISYPRRFDARGLAEDLTAHLAALQDEIRSQLPPEVIRRSRLAASSALHPQVSDDVRARIAAEIDARYTADRSALDAQTAAALAPTGNVADSAMNGAQITALVSVIEAAAQRRIPRDSAVATVARGYAMSMEDADALIGSAGRGFDTTPEADAAAIADLPAAPADAVG